MCQQLSDYEKEVGRLQYRLQSPIQKVTWILEIRRLQLELEKFTEAPDYDNEDQSRDSWFDPDDEKLAISSLLGKRSYLELNRETIQQSEPERELLSLS